MTGVLWAVVSGVGFGVFQVVNARAVRAADDPYLSMLVRVVIAGIVLSVAWLATEDLDSAVHAPAWAVLSFVVAGVVHFIGGWSLLNFSHRRIGAARTSPLLTTSPMFGVAIAAVTLGELPGPGALGGVALMVAGAYVVSRPEESGPARLGDSLFGLGTALMWAISPIFVVHGLEGMDSPLTALVIGLWSSALVAGIAWLAFGRRGGRRALVRGVIGLELAGGLLAGLASWARWIALDFAEVGVVLGLALLSVPTVLLLAHFLGRRVGERTSAAVWLGAGLVLVGALVVIGAER